MSSKKFTLKLHQGNVQSELLRNPAIMELVERKANEIAEAAVNLSGLQDGYEVEARPYGSTRTAVKVSTVTPHAYYQNLKHNTLLKAKGQVKE